MHSAIKVEDERKMMEGEGRLGNAAKEARRRLVKSEQRPSLTSAVAGIACVRQNRQRQAAERTTQGRLGAKQRMRQRANKEQTSRRSSSGSRPEGSEEVNG